MPTLRERFINLFLGDERRRLQESAQLLDEYNDGFPMGFMEGTAASMLDFVLMGGDLCKALGLEETLMPTCGQEPLV